MASYQDIESRLRVVEDKIDFTMKAFAVQRTERSAILGGNDRVVTKHLLDLYRETVTSAAVPIYRTDIDEAVIDAVVEEIATQATGDEVV